MGKIHDILGNCFGTDHNGKITFYTVMPGKSKITPDDWDILLGKNRKGLAFRYQKPEDYDAVIMEKNVEEPDPPEDPYDFEQQLAYCKEERDWLDDHIRYVGMNAIERGQLRLKNAMRPGWDENEITRGLVYSMIYNNVAFIYLMDYSCGIKTELDEQIKKLEKMKAAGKARRLKRKEVHDTSIYCMCGLVKALHPSFVKSDSKTGTGN